MYVSKFNTKERSLKLGKNLFGMNSKDLIAVMLIVFISLVIILVGSIAFNTYEGVGDGMDIAEARIISIEDVSEETIEYSGNNTTTKTSIVFRAKILTGSLDGEVVSVTQNIDTLYALQDLPVEEKDKVLITLTTDPSTGEKVWMFANYDRVDTLLLLTGAFLLLLIIIGRRQGTMTVLSLILMCAMIFLVYLPSVLSGVNIYLATCLMSVYLVIMSLTIIGGVSKKTLAAILGNLGGVLIAGILAYLLNDHMKMTGLIDDTYAFLTVAEGDEKLDLVALVWSGIVLGSIGAIMDVAMSISSAMTELDEHMSEKSFKKLVKSGMNIGRDALGTMTNTLILAYLGGSLALVLLFMLNTKVPAYLLSLEMIVEQVVQSIVGSMGILFAVPFTAVFSAYIFMKEKKTSKEIESKMLGDSKRSE